MKKFIMTLSTVIMLMGLVIGTMALTGCGFVSSLQGPVNEWCQKDIEYGDTTLTTYIMYCNGRYKTKKNEKPITDDEKLDWTKKGIYFIVTAYKDDDDSVVDDVFLANKYAVMFWAEGDKLNVSDDDDEESTLDSNFLSLKCSKAKWAILYYNDDDLIETTSDALPFVLDKRSRCSRYDGKLSWKSILAAILVKKLLEE